MNVWELPTSLEIGGVGFSIRSDYRAIIDILQILEDSDFEQDEKEMCTLIILYEDYESIPYEHRIEALEKAYQFISMYDDSTPNAEPNTMSWEQDAQLIIPAINKVIGKEVRTEQYMHWWTFMSAYMEIGQGLFSEVINIRQKKRQGKRLDEFEREFYRKNKELVDMKPKLSKEEEERKKKINDLLNGY